MEAAILGRFSVVGATVALAAALASAASVGISGVEQPASTPAANPAAAAPGAQPLTPGAVVLVDTTAPTITIGADGRARVTVFVANTTKANAEVKVSVKLRSAKGGVIETETTTSPVSVVAGGEPVPVTADTRLLQGLPGGEAFPLSGVLMLASSPAANGDAAANGVKTLAIASIERRNDGAEWPLLWQSFMMALAAVAVAAGALAKRRPGALGLWIGGPKWSFSESWSSTITIAGAVLTGLLGFGGLPDYGHAMSKKTYGIASLLFASLIMMAPGVFNLFRRVKAVKESSGATVLQTQGLVPFFLAAALLTTTGVLSQLRLLETLFGDLGDASIISSQTANAFSWACRALVGVLTIYAGASMYLTAVEQADFQEKVVRDAVRNKAAAAASTGRGREAATVDAPPRLPDWNLL